MEVKGWVGVERSGVAAKRRSRTHGAGIALAAALAELGRLGLLGRLGGGRRALALAGSALLGEEHGQGERQRDGQEGGQRGTGRRTLHSPPEVEQLSLERWVGKPSAEVEWHRRRGTEKTHEQAMLKDLGLEGRGGVGEGVWEGGDGGSGAGAIRPSRVPF